MITIIILLIILGSILGYLIVRGDLNDTGKSERNKP